MLKYFELTITVFLKKDIYFIETNALLSKIIIKAMALDKQLLEKHLDTGYKHYVFSGFYPIEKDKYYKEGRVYIYRIRTLDSYLSQKLMENLPLIEDANIKTISVQVQEQKRRYINHIYTLTPAVATVNNEYWTLGDDIFLLQERIQNNLEKKYKDFYEEEIKIENPFISSIEILNKKPIVYRYKTTSIVGNRLRIFVNSDEISQKLAFIAVSTGLLEKNSALGMGFCLAK